VTDGRFLKARACGGCGSDKASREVLKRRDMLELTPVPARLDLARRLIGIHPYAGRSGVSRVHPGA
jgi:hypothetical protein